MASGCPLLLPEVRHVSMRLCRRIPTTSEVAARIMKQMDWMGWEKAGFIGHSYGSFLASAIVQQYKGRVQMLALIDPVCLGEPGCMWF